MTDVLGLRLGVHTGLVVVRGISPDLQLTYTASGATLEVASELQQWSQEGAIVVSEAVQQQAAGFFRFTALGVHTLPEVPEPMQVYTCAGIGSVDVAAGAGARAGADGLLRAGPGVGAARGLLGAGLPGDGAGGVPGGGSGHWQIALGV